MTHDFVRIVVVLVLAAAVYWLLSLAGLPTFIAALAALLVVLIGLVGSRL